MFCDRCGTKLNDAQAFCTNCGKPMYPVPTASGTNPPPPPPPFTPAAAYPARVPINRVAGHTRILAICWLVYSALHLLPMVGAMFFFGFIRQGMGPEVPDFVPVLIQTVLLVVAGFSVLGCIAGWGLLNLRPWARMFAIVLGVINLLNVPLGTALGIYTLWVLLPAESEQQYAQQSYAGGVPTQATT